MSGRVGVAVAFLFLTGCADIWGFGDVTLGEDDASIGGVELDGTVRAGTESGGGDANGSDSTLSDGGKRDADSANTSCPDGGSTTISGIVYDPANVNPLYNVAIYVPGVAPLPALPSGVACGSCADLYSSPMAAAVTDATGSFKIPNAPDGKNIPLVIQAGKWRMLYTIPNVTACQDNPQVDHSLRLPRSHTEGDIPNIAVSTGGADTLECLLLRMGVDASEYEPGGQGPGRIHIFAGGTPGTFFGVNIGASPNTSPPGPVSSAALWNNDTDINQFDVVLLSCEGKETMNMNQQVLLDYANAGGRVFASHFQYAWFNSGPFATMTSPPLATWRPGEQPLGGISANIVTALPNDLAFPDGVAMNTWLGHVGALVGGELPIVNAFHNADVTATNTYSQAWISADENSPAPGGTEYFSFDLPLGTSAAGHCGRVVYGDLHDGLGPGAGSDPDYPDIATDGGIATEGGIVPSGCSTHTLTPQERALEFMVFDLSSCLIPVGQSETPPTVQ